jgi:hypothetical protein
MRQTGAKNPGDLPRFVVDLAVSQGQNLVTEGSKGETASAVVLESRTPSVVAIAIGFHDQHLVAPEEIGEVRTDADIDLGHRQPVTVAKAEEITLEIAASTVVSSLVIEREAQHARLPDGSPQPPRRDLPSLS